MAVTDSHSDIENHGQSALMVAVSTYDKNTDIVLHLRRLLMRV